ncbi:putative terpene synthase 2 [Senna tora]|uniref:Putative terpene synthase 2 n=1 Tax=Senna tora TaxID=362788 RepID=A0A834WWZ7_9FABA|nr:putative terpene synthase 2 [Senna tora]
MSIIASTLSPHNDNIASSTLSRHTADYHPTLWTHYFLQFASQSLEVDDETMKRIETMKDEVRKMLVPTTENPLGKVDLIDSIQRLGLSYHFEAEIDQVLHQIHKHYVQHHKITLNQQHHHLHSHALLFRLLRQQGYFISPDVFNKFKDEEGKFSEEHSKDVEGMLSLYEAAHLSIHGETILDEALAFTSTKLGSITIDQSNSNPFLAAQVVQTLNQTPYRGLPRLEARKYISIYHQHPSHNQLLLTLAKLDFNTLQKLHQKEFGNICKWDVCCLDDLPEYLKLPYKEVLNFFEETEEEMRKEGRAYSVQYTKKELVEAYMSEARWLNRKYIPTTEEYMKIATISCCYPLLSTSSFIGMGHIASQHIFQWAQTHPNIFKASSTICRIMDDIFEQERGHVASVVECYKKEHGVSREEAIDELRKRIGNAWKDMNQECLYSKVGMPFVERLLNLTRFMDVIYKQTDNYTHAQGLMKNSITELLLHPLPI